MRLSQTATIIQDFKSSGMMLKNRLYENNIYKDQYYYWLKKFKMEVIKFNTQIFVDVSEVPQPPTVVEFGNLPID